MMSNIAIRANGLGKRYRLGGSLAGYKTFRESLIAAMRAPLAMLQRDRKPPEAFWALQDVSFEIEHGEAVGIIGRNGAGKSTLLKILSRITKPTTGRAELYGRVGSLLEVGTGFHPELTGRENIFLNGAILGMRRRETERKFDEIVAFAGVELFLDTPVKHYSSGMYVRLAFAVAAHLEPEILMVDEVLAVGDFEFQKKCLGKMQDVSSSGRTVLFVSHSMTAVTRLCRKALLLEHGRLKTYGETNAVISEYLKVGATSTASREWPQIETAPGTATAKLRAVRVLDENDNLSASLDIRRPMAVETEFDVFEDGYKLVPNYHFYTSEGICAFIAADQDPAWRGVPRRRGRYKSRVVIPGNFLSEGTMIVHVALSVQNPVEIHFNVRDAVVFQVVDSLEGDSVRGEWAGNIPGVIRPRLAWQTEFHPF